MWSKKNPEQYRFYAEMPTKQQELVESQPHPAYHRMQLGMQVKNGLRCNVIAVPLENNTAIDAPAGRVEAHVMESEDTGSPFIEDWVNLAYLRERCVRISRELALKFAPQLASRINNKSK